MSDEYIVSMLGTVSRRTKWSFALCMTEAVLFCVGMAALMVWVFFTDLI